MTQAFLHDRGEAELAGALTVSNGVGAGPLTGMLDEEDTGLFLDQAIADVIRGWWPRVQATCWRQRPSSNFGQDLRLTARYPRPRLRVPLAGRPLCFSYPDPFPSGVDTRVKRYGDSTERLGPHVACCVARLD